MDKEVNSLFECRDIMAFSYITDALHMVQKDHYWGNTLPVDALQSGSAARNNFNW